MRRLLRALALLAPSAALALTPPTSRTLPNGLEVLVVEEHSLPLVTVEVAVHNGSFTESPEYNGLSHLYEHMFFKANAALPNQEAFMTRMRELGIQWNGTTNTERVNYFFTTTKEHFDDSMVFMKDALLTTLFDPQELQRERVVVTGEIDRFQANPFYPFVLAMDQKTWWKHTTRKRPIGTREAVLATTPEKMRTIKDRYYVPNNSVLVIAGDVVPDHAFELAEKLFGAWKRAPDPFKKYPVPVHPPIQRTEAIVMQSPQVKTVTFISTWHGPSTVGPTVPFTYAADLLAFAVAEPSSTFQKDLVDSGACVRAGFTYLSQAYTGSFTVSAEAVPEKADACVTAMKAELLKMKEPGYLTPEEMKSAAFRAEVSQLQEREETSDYAHVLTYWWASASLDYYFHYVENLGKVTPQDVARVVTTYVIDKPYVFGAMTSPDAAKEHKLDQAHFEALLGIGGVR
jgi:zinc protease